MMIQELVNLYFVGHLGNAAKLAAVGLGNAIQNMIGISIIVGMNGALNSLVSQAGGAGNLDLCIGYLQRGKIVMTICFIPISLLILNSKQILLLIGQDPQVAAYAHTYNIYYLPAVYLYGLVDAERRFLNCLKRNFVTLMVQSIGTLFHVFACYFFVDILKYDIQGIGLASIITNFIIYVLIIAYSRNIPEIKNTAKSDFLVTKQGLYEYFLLGAPCAIMVALEWWAYQLMMVLSGIIGVPEQAAQIVLCNIAGFLFMVALGCQ